MADPSGAAISGAAVRATNVATALSWETRTDSEGRYSIELLPPGLYNVEASAANFAAAESPDVRLAVNASQRVDFTLALATLREKIQVEGAARLLETDTSEQGMVVTQKLIQDLPLNGRDFIQLARLAPGVTPSFDNISSQAGPFNANGQRDLSNNILIDGINVNAGGSSRGRISISPGADPAVGQAGSSLSLISVDGIAEFKVQTQLATAEFGGFSGAVVNVNSRSGSNELHGSAFDFLRNDALDANNFFFNANGAPKVPMRNNLFGGSLGGPARKDRTFFFGSLEGLRQRVGVSSNGRVPSRAARASAAGVIKPLIDLYPLPTGPDNPDGTAPYFAATSNLVGETAFSIRVDHRLTDKDDVFGRYSFSDSLGVIRSFYLNFLTNNRSRLQTATVAHVHRASALVYNEARAGFVRSANFQLGALDGFGGARPVSLDAAGNAVDPGILIFSLPFAVAHNPLFAHDNNLFSAADNLTVIRGRNSLRFGFWARHVQANVNLKPLVSGVYFFDTVADLLANTPSFFFNQVALSGLGVRFTNYAWYAQDDLAFSRRLRLNLGVRYELNTVPTEAHGRLSPLAGLNNPATATLGRPGDPLYNGDHNNFAPRFGFAYQVTEDAKTVLRGGAGVYYDLPTLNIDQPVFGPPFKITNFVTGVKLGGEVRAPVNPALLQTQITGKPPFGSATLYDPEHFRTPYSYQYNLNLQRELDRKTVAQASFVGAQGRRLLRLRPLNLVDARTGEAPNQNFSPGSLELIETTAGSNYNALQLGATRRLDHGLELIAAYTWSHSLDDVSNGTGTSLVSSFTGSNPYHLRAEHASSDFDLRQNFTLAFSYALPWRERRLGGWSVQGIFNTHTAFPFTPLLGQDIAGNGDMNATSNQRPNVVAGQPLYVSSPQPPFRVANIKAFAEPGPGTYGNAARNILRASGLTQFDFSVTKDIRLRERLALQFRAEFFNLLNHPNFASPAASTNHLLTAGDDFGLSRRMANESAGGMLGPLFSAGGPRSVQLALKLVF